MTASQSRCSDYIFHVGRGTIDLAALNTEQSDIWKKLKIIETEAWFSTVQAIASGASG